MKKTECACACSALMAPVVISASRIPHRGSHMCLGNFSAAVDKPHERRLKSCVSFHIPYSTPFTSIRCLSVPMLIVRHWISTRPKLNDLEELTKTRKLNPMQHDMLPNSSSSHGWPIPQSTGWPV